jgi:hypothetical protein
MDTREAEVAAARARYNCLVCLDRSKLKCMICGKKRGPSQQEKDAELEHEQQRRRRMDFLGETYNKMRKFRMRDVGCPLTQQVHDYIGDPLAPGAEAYEPYYKPKRNEV